MSDNGDLGYESIVEVTTSECVDGVQTVSTIEWDAGYVTETELEPREDWEFVGEKHEEVACVVEVVPGSPPTDQAPPSDLRELPATGFDGGLIFGGALLLAVGFAAIKRAARSRG